MKNPRSINLKTDVEFKELGWSAVVRDADGHALSLQSGFLDGWRTDARKAATELGGSVTWLE